MGTVGTGVLQGLEKNKSLIQARKNLQFELISVAVRNLNLKREVSLDTTILTTNPDEVINHPEVDIVVELMGGIEPTYQYVSQALKNKKSVVTANKALISKYGAELFNLARENKVGLFFEASVAGGVPIIKTLQSSLAANAINGMQGILNGTCNYILSQMEKGIEFKEALLDAQKKGYAEADPSLDIDGVDTAHKAAILASLVYGRWFNTEEIETNGIRGMHLQDIKFAKELGYKIKLIADIKKSEDETVSISVNPTLVAKGSMLSSVNDVFNAIKVNGNMVGDTLFYGHGAGKDATASATCADILEAAKALVNNTLAGHPNFNLYSGCKGLTNPQDLTNHYYIRFTVKNQLASVVASITKELGNRSISIASIHQEESKDEFIPIILVTHRASTQKLQDAIIELKKEAFIQGNPIIYPVAKLSNS